MSLVDSATSSYVETVTTTIPFHRAALALVSAFLFLSNRGRGNESLLEFLWSLPTSEVTSMSSSLMSQSVIGDFISAAAIIVIAIVLTKLLARPIFSLALRSTSLMSRINSIKVHDNQPLDSNKKEIIDLTKSGLEASAKRIRSLNRIVEFIFGCGIQIIFLAFFNTFIEAIVGFVLVFISIFLLVYSIKIFISDYFGLAMYIAKLEGKPTPSPSDLNNSQ